MANCGKEFKLKAQLGRHYGQVHGIQLRSGSPRPIMKTRSAFYLFSNPAARLSRRLCRHIVRSKKAARQPSYSINVVALKQEFPFAEVPKSIADIRRLLTYKKRDRGSVTHIANRLGNPGPTVGDWLILTPKDKMPKPEVVAFPKPPKAPDGSLIYDRIPNKVEAEPKPLSMGAAAAVAVANSLPGVTVNAIGGGGGGAGASTPVPPGIPTLGSTAGVTAGRTTPNAIGTGPGLLASSPITPIPPVSLKRRNYEDANGIDGPVAPPPKRPNKDPMPSHRPTPEQYAAMMAAAQAAGQPLPRHHMNGKPKIAQMARTGSGRKQVISWMDAPDDVYYRSTEASKKTRRKIPIIELRRSARKPWRCLAPKYAAIIATLLPPVTSGSTAAAAAAAAAAAGIPQLPATLPPQLTAQLTSAPGQLPHPAAVAANLNLNSNMAAVASLASVHPLAAQLIAGNNSSSANSNSGSTNINSSSSNKANSDLQVVILD